MKNQAVVDIEDYYNLRKGKETLENTIKELKDVVAKQHGDILRLKSGIILLATDSSRNNPAVEPSFKIDYEGSKLIVKVKPDTVISDRFNDADVIGETLRRN